MALSGRLVVQEDDPPFPLPADHAAGPGCRHVWPQGASYAGPGYTGALGIPVEGLIAAAKTR